MNIRMPSEGQSFKFLDMKFTVKKSSGFQFIAMAESNKNSLKLGSGKTFTLRKVKFNIKKLTVKLKKVRIVAVAVIPD